MLDEQQRDTALIHFQRGLHLERAHRVSEAVAEYRLAIEHDPLLREAHDALGCYYQRRGLLAKAAEEFRVVATLEGDFLSHFNLGCILLELGRLDDALAVFERCRVIQPDDPACDYELGYIYFLKGNYYAAIQQLRTPLRHYPDDWEVHHLIGCCHLRLGDYDLALETFGHALRLAPHLRAERQVSQHLRAIERYRELGVPRWAKDRLYAEQGVVYLGSAQDDGLRLDEFHDFHFTYPDIGATLRRLLANQAAHGWAFSCVVSLDRQSAPLANALAVLLERPLRRADELASSDVALFVLGVGREAELLNLANERATCPAVTFCMGLNWLRHSAELPDIAGVIARGACSVPWESELRRLRCDGAPADQIGECLAQAAAQILAATREPAPEPSLARQVHYYRRHSQLRFVDLFAPARSAHIRSAAPA